MVTAFTVMLVCVGVPLTVGTPLTAAPSPLATALALTVPVGVIAAVAPVTLPCGIEAGSPIFTALALYVVGVPDMETVTTVLLVLTAVAAVNPAGSPETAKLAGVIVVAYCPLVSV